MTNEDGQSSTQTSENVQHSSIKKNENAQSSSIQTNENIHSIKKNENAQSSSIQKNENIHSIKKNENAQSSSTQKNENIQSSLTQINESSQSSNPFARKMTRKEKFKLFKSIGLMIFFEIALPLILYYVLENYIGELWALFISGIPPFLVVLYGIIRRMRVDVLGAMIIIGFIVGAISAAVKHDERLYLLRESAITGTVGIIYLITLIPIKIGSFQMRPIMYYFIKDMVTGGSFGYSTSESQGLTEDEISDRWEKYWNSYAMFRNGFIVLTVVWGIGLIVEVPVRVMIVFNNPVDRAVYLSNIVTYSWVGVLTLFHTVYGSKFRKRCMKLAEEAAKQTKTLV